MKLQSVSPHCKKTRRPKHNSIIEYLSFENLSFENLKKKENMNNNIFKIGIAAWIFCFYLQIHAETMRLNAPHTTTAQELFYSKAVLEKILNPSGFLLDPFSINIFEKVAFSHFPSPMIIETKEFAVRYLKFITSKNGVKFSGDCYLIFLYYQNLENSQIKNELIFNATAIEMSNYRWNGRLSSTILLISVNPSYQYFKQMPSPQDFNLRAI